ncbi:MAG: TetR/AcrR family transcriptional regulator [Ilumatobacteraceae bacterium]
MVVKAITPDPPATGTGKRLVAADRKRLIIKAARRAFTQSGDVRGTTVKQIALEAGISEGIIYRHFENKEDLFVQASVEPLTEAINSIVSKLALLQIDLSGRELDHLSVLYWKDLIEGLRDLVPLLGLVLFGDPEYSVPFYRDVLLPALERVTVSWNEGFRRITEEDYPHPHAVMAHFGMALIFAVDQKLALNPESSSTLAASLASMEASRFGPVMHGALKRLANAQPAAESAAPKSKSVNKNRVAATKSAKSAGVKSTGVKSTGVKSTGAKSTGAKSNSSRAAGAKSARAASNPSAQR